MGLTGGIADVGSLYDSLVGIHTGQADDSILDKYDEIRRKIWHDIIDPVSSNNMRRLIDLDADTAVENDPFLHLLKRMETDKKLQLEMSKVSFCYYFYLMRFQAANLAETVHPIHITTWILTMR